MDELARPGGEPPEPRAGGIPLATVRWPLGFGWLTLALAGCFSPTFAVDRPCGAADPPCAPGQRCEAQVCRVICSATATSCPAAHACNFNIGICLPFGDGGSVDAPVDARGIDGPAPDGGILQNCIVDSCDLLRQDGCSSNSRCAIRHQDQVVVCDRGPEGAGQEGSVCAFTPCSDTCARGLYCVPEATPQGASDGVCRRLCGDNNVCGSGAACILPVKGPAQVSTCQPHCSVFDQSSCRVAGEACYYAASIDGEFCLPPGGGAVGQVCVQPNECSRGLICVKDITSADIAHCYPPCQVGSMCDAVALCKPAGSVNDAMLGFCP